MSKPQENSRPSQTVAATKLLGSESFSPYLYIVGFSMGLLLLGIASNSPPIGSLFGSALGSIDFRYHPYFTLGVIAIYFLRKPLLAISATVVFAMLYQVYLTEFSDALRIWGAEPPPYFQFSRVFGGILLLSLIGLCHFIIKKLF